MSAYPIRTLPVEEWPKLEAQFAERHVALPDPRLARIVVAEDGSQIVAFLVVQMVPHLEPIWIDRRYRGKLHWPRLVTAAKKHLDAKSSYFAFAPNAHIARMIDAAGLTRLPWTIFSGTADAPREVH